MIARYTGASLGLLAFAVATISGLLVQNPVSMILSRGIFALFVFFIIGMVLGHAAQMVITEYESGQQSEIEKRYGEQDVDTEVDDAETGSSVGELDAVNA